MTFLNIFTFLFLPEGIFSSAGKERKMEDSENVTSNITKIAEVEENMATTINIVVRLILIVFGSIGNVYL